MGISVIGTWNTILIRLPISKGFICRYFWGWYDVSWYSTSFMPHNSLGVVFCWITVDYFLCTSISDWLYFLPNQKCVCRHKNVVGFKTIAANFFRIMALRSLNLLTIKHKIVTIFWAVFAFISIYIIINSFVVYFSLHIWSHNCLLFVIYIFVSIFLEIFACCSYFLRLLYSL